MKFFFFFLDGVGLGEDDTDRNPFARAKMPYLQNLLEGYKLVADGLLFSGKVNEMSISDQRYATFENVEIPSPKRFENDRCALLALDACMGVKGMPQSATGQATILTGENMPAMLGLHQGPKPNAKLILSLRKANLIKTLLNAGLDVALLNAFPPVYFDNVKSGQHKQGVIAFAVSSAGVSLKTVSDLVDEKAISADFTGRGWREQLDFPSVPQLDPFEAGQRLGTLAQKYDFSIFEYWMSDYIGHRCNMNTACATLEEIDQVLGGLLDVWDDEDGIILISSDHGNLEDLNTRHHTYNYVPALVIGAPHLSLPFSVMLHNLSDIAPAVIQFLT